MQNDVGQQLNGIKPKNKKKEITHCHCGQVYHGKRSCNYAEF